MKKHTIKVCKKHHQRGKRRCFFCEHEKGKKK